MTDYLGKRLYREAETMMKSIPEIFGRKVKLTFLTVRVIDYSVPNITTQELHKYSGHLIYYFQKENKKQKQI